MGIIEVKSILKVIGVGDAYSQEHYAEWNPLLQSRQDIGSWFSWVGQSGSAASFLPVFRSAVNK